MAVRSADSQNVPPGVAQMFRRRLDNAMKAKSRFLKSHSPNAKEAVKLLDQHIAIYSRALTSGEYQTDKLVVVLRSEKSFVRGKEVSRVSRGQPFKVIGVEGSLPGSVGTEWWRIRLANGVEGWANVATMTLTAPPEFSSATGPFSGSPDHGVENWAARG